MIVKDNHILIPVQKTNPSVIKKYTIKGQIDESTKRYMEKIKVRIQPPEVNVWMKTYNYYIFPLTYPIYEYFEKYEDIDNQKELKIYDELKFVDNFDGKELSKLQKDALRDSIDKINCRINKGIARVYIELPTGEGKTILGLSIAKQFQYTLVIAPTRQICNQWRKYEVEAYTFAFFRKISSEKRKEICERNDIVILDEAHELPTPVNLKILWSVMQNQLVIGLSATTSGRSDGLSPVLKCFLGKPLQYTIENKHNFIVKACRYPYENDEIDEERVQFIYEQIEPYLDRSILIVCRKRKDVEFIANNLNVDAKAVHGKTKSDCVEIALKTGNIFVMTYAYCSRGLSISKLTVLVIASPRKGSFVKDELSDETKNVFMTQLIGRITRKDGPVCDRIIIDIIDKSAIHQWYIRKKYYNLINAKIL